jgi:hypothetical protein
MPAWSRVKASPLMPALLKPRVVEVGHVIYSPALQRTPLGTEAQFLLARYAFETLGYRRYEWNCNALNEPSDGEEQTWSTATGCRMSTIPLTEP